jgi:hypothetical protein
MSDYWFICYEWQTEEKKPMKENKFINQPPWVWLHNRRNNQQRMRVISAIPVSVDTFDRWHKYFD